MNKLFKINEKFKKTLQEMRCITFEDEIEVYKKEGEKIFFKIGSARLHFLNEEEFKEATIS